ncbi:MAG: Hpt domain-containing protein [Sphingomonadaceae bacterium]
MNLDQALQTFIAESRELLEDMENALLNVDLAGDQSEAIGAIFRAAHTIKGSAGLFSLDHIVAFTHVVESLLDEVRDCRVTLNDGMIVLLLSCCDYLSGMIDGLAAGRLEADPDSAAEGEMLLQQLRRQMECEVAVPADADAGAAVLAMAGRPDPTVERIEDERGDSDYWHISLRFGRGVLQNGMDPIAFLRYLGKLGRIVAIAV